MHLRATVATSHLEPDARVLVIDPDDDMRDALLLLFQAEGWPAIGVTTGAKAIALFRRGLRPQVIILDLMLQGSSGFAFRAEQLADPVLRLIPTIVVSAIAQSEIVRRTLQVQHFLSKPFDIDRLLAMVRVHCERQPAAA